MVWEGVRSKSTPPIINLVATRGTRPRVCPVLDIENIHVWYVDTYLTQC